MLLAHWKKVLVLVVLVAIAVTALQKKDNATDTMITDTARLGDVTQIVSVSGTIEAKNTASLAFPGAGTITEVFVDEGSQVTAGEVIATQATGQLVAERAQAVALLQSAEAQYAEALTGATDEERAVSLAGVSSAADNLEQTLETQSDAVANARRVLLSTDLEARAVDPDETATAPTITGSYTCAEEGTYTIAFYRSGAASQYSYSVTGLETFTTEAYTDQPAPFGDCGLFIQIADSVSYRASAWEITVPNTRSTSYVANKNAYEAARQTQSSAVTAAQNALTVAEEEAAVITTGVRSEVLTQRSAAVREAQARVAAIDARLGDRSIVAPFAGEVTNVSVIAGETANTEPVITLLAEDAFEVIARIPEIDVRKAAIGQTAYITFDASTDEKVAGTVTYISPLATQIDGVAYFETTIVLTDDPNWLRAGLNADIDIVTDTVTDTLRVPARYVRTLDDGSYVVRTLTGDILASTTVEVQFKGNDGFWAVTGIADGTTIVAP